MLLSSKVTNWKSFRDETPFSMVATREEQHAERLARIERLGVRALPVSALYGGNASGKSNFCEALRFARDLVVQGTQPDAPIPIQPFRLDDSSPTRPAEFVFEVVTADKCYEFGFAVTRKRVVREWLTELRKTTERALYRRDGDNVEFLDASLRAAPFAAFVAQGTRSNQLVLKNFVDQNDKRFLPLYRWFSESLLVVGPGEASLPVGKGTLSNDGTYDTLLSDALGRLDTSIDALGSEEVAAGAVALPSDVKVRAIEASGKAQRAIVVSPGGQWYTIIWKDKEPTWYKIGGLHQRSDGSEVLFDLADESDGTRRVIELLPVFLNASASSSAKVAVIDELDRSLHTLLTRRLLEGYLDSRQPESRSQIIFTTHDVQLMDQALLRRDEMWVAERGNGGATHLIPFSDYKDIRKDKDIRKSYLQGRLGGVPRIVQGGPLAPASGGDDRGNSDGGPA